MSSSTMSWTRRHAHFINGGSDYAGRTAWVPWAKDDSIAMQIHQWIQVATHEERNIPDGDSGRSRNAW